MALGFPFGIRVVNPEPLDPKYGPYASLAEARAKVLPGERHLGLTVNVVGVEYWWENGVLDGDLVEKVKPDRFKGYHPTLVALQNAYPAGAAGDYAVVDAGVGTNAQKYIWDTNDNAWVISGGAPVPFASEAIEGTVEEGTQAEVNDNANTGVGITGARLFVSIPKLWGWWTYVKTIAQSISGQWTFASPIFTGTPTAPTAAPGTSTTQVATTAFVASAITNFNATQTELNNRNTNYSIPFDRRRYITVNFTASVVITADNTNATLLAPILMRATGVQPTFDESFKLVAGSWSNVLANYIRLQRIANNEIHYEIYQI